jgi:hypothetical protein
MNKICERYLSDVKALFPSNGKDEKKYLSKLSITIDEYNDEKEITHINDLYEVFGLPNDVVNAYLTTIDTSLLVKKIQYTKWVKRGLVIFLFLVLIGVSIFALTTYREYEIFKQEQIFFEEESIE